MRIRPVTGSICGLVSAAAFFAVVDTAPAQAQDKKSADQDAAQAQTQDAKASKSDGSNAAAKCPISRDDLVKALRDNVKPTSDTDNGGLPTNEWAAVVDRNGKLCAIAFSGDKPTDQWLGSRGIAIEKANTVNAFSLDDYAISTANLWAPSQPGGQFYGANLSNPPLADLLYKGPVSDWGTENDPALGKVVGGVIPFGGGLALYDDSGLLGGLGASGNTACADHNIAWRVRAQLGLDKVPAGPSPDNNDEIIYDVGADKKSQSGWGHTTCGFSGAAVAEKIGSGVVKVAKSPAAKGALPPSTPATTSSPLDTQPPKPKPEQKKQG